MPTLDSANRKFIRKMLLIWVITVVLFCISIGDFEVIGSVSKWVAGFIPAVQSQFDKATVIGDVAGRYFGLAALLTPVGAVYLLGGDDVVVRARAGMERLGSAWKYLLTVGLITIPVCILMLGFIYFSPLDAPENPRLFGQIVVYALVNTYPGLLIFGSLAIVAVVILVFILISYLVLPVLLIKNLKKRA